MDGTKIGMGTLKKLNMSLKKNARRRVEVESCM